MVKYQTAEQSRGKIMSRTFTVIAPVGEERIFAVDSKFVNWTATLKFFDAGGAEVVPSAGSVAVGGMVIGSGGYADFSASPIDATASGNYASGQAPLEKIKVSPSGIVGATSYQFSVTGA